MALENKSFGGQLMNIATVENYPGFEGGVSGAILGSAMLNQATNFGLEINLDEVISLDILENFLRVKCSGETYEAKVVILAGGAQHQKLGIPGEAEYTGRGVSYCATCDGAMCVEKPVAVIGGGDAAITEALYLSKFASRVFVIHRRRQLRAVEILQEKAFAKGNIEFVWNSVAEEILGEAAVNQIKLRRVDTEEISTLDIAGVFVSIGLKPNTDYLKGILTLDDAGGIITNAKMETDHSNVLAAGDIRSGSACQIATAVGDGVIAALSAEALLQEIE